MATIKIIGWYATYTCCSCEQSRTIANLLYNFLYSRLGNNTIYLLVSPQSAKQIHTWFCYFLLKENKSWHFMCLLARYCIICEQGQKMYLRWHLRSTKTHIRLRGCASWYRSSLDAYVKRYVFSRCESYIDDQGRFWSDCATDLDIQCSHMT